MTTRPTAEAPRVTRAASLGRELIDVMDRLAHGGNAADAVVFLDVLTRCGGFATEELALADATAAYAMAQELLDVDGAAISDAAARALNIEGLVDRAWRQVEQPVDTEVVPLAIDALTVATIAELLPGQERERAMDACERLLALFSGHPEVFEESESVGLDRARFERPSKLPTAAREFVAMLRALPQLGSLDAAADHTDVPAVAKSHIAKAQRSLTETSWFDQLVVGSKEWASQIARMFRSMTSPSATPLYADSGTDVPEHVVLRRINGGSLLLVQQGTELFVEWQGEGDAPSLARMLDETRIPLTPLPRVGAVQWRLDSSAAGSVLELSFGANRVLVELPSNKP